MRKLETTYIKERKKKALRNEACRRLKGATAERKSEALAELLKDKLNLSKHK